MSQQSKYIVIVDFLGEPLCTACGILVLPPGIKPRPSTVKAQSSNHWNKQEIPTVNYTYVYIYIGEGNGTPLQYSCLENPMDGEAW